MSQAQALLIPIVPPKVQAAQSFLYFTKAITSPENGIGRELDHEEEKAYSAAVEVLRLYFSGEYDFSPQLQPIGFAVDESADEEIGDPVNA